MVCAHLRPGRDKRRTTYLMQPIGLHVASLIDQAVFDVRLHDEDSHGPLEVADCRDSTSSSSRTAGRFLPVAPALILLPPQRRRGGCGGSICTTFPEFASQFFDAVCAGGVDSVPAVVADFLKARSNRSIDRLLRSFLPTRSTTPFHQKRHQPRCSSDRGNKGMQLQMLLLCDPGRGRAMPATTSAHENDRQRYFDQPDTEFSSALSDLNDARQQFFRRS